MAKIPLLYSFDSPENDSMYFLMVINAKPFPKGRASVFAEIIDNRSWSRIQWDCRLPTL